MDIGPLSKDTQSVPVAPVPAHLATIAQNRELIQAVKSANAAEHFGMDSELTFAMDPHTQRRVIRLINRNTKEVIQQIPAEYVLELAKRTGGATG